MLLALLAAWHLPLAYPVPGSQLYFGTYLVLVSALVCLSDLLDEFSRALRGDSLAGSLAALLTPLVLVSLLLAALLRDGSQLARAYDSLEPLGFDGTRPLRIEPGRAALYRQLSEEVQQADAVFINSSFNSLYFWSGTAMAAPVLVGHDLRFSSPENRDAIARGLAAAERPLVVQKRPRYGLSPAGTNLDRWIAGNFEVVRTLGDFQLLRRRVAAAPAAGDSGPVRTGSR